MDFKQALEKAKNRRETVDIDINLSGQIFKVTLTRLPGTIWAMLTAKCPPESEMHYFAGYNTEKAALLACKEHATVTDQSGAKVDGVDWEELFNTISGVEVKALAASWWGLNENEPNNELMELKKTFLNT